jgi:hypothetical protein
LSRASRRTCASTLGMTPSSPTSRIRLPLPGPGSRRHTPSSPRTLRVTLRVLSVHRLDWVAALVGGRS